MKHPDPEALALYETLVRKYADALDLMSPRGLRGLPARVSDALEYARVLSAEAPQTIVDIGSGVGLPGLIVAMALPQADVHLVERRQRRAAFLKIAAAQLELSNVYIHDRSAAEVEGLRAPIFTAQAVGRFAALYCLTLHLHAPDIILVSRKGHDWPAEVSELERTLDLTAREVVTSPLSARGTLVGVRVEGGRPCRSSA